MGNVFVGDVFVNVHKVKFSPVDTVANVQRVMMNVQFMTHAFYAQHFKQDHTN